MSASAASIASAAMRQPLGNDRLRCTPDRRAAHIGRARTAVPAAHRDQIGIALAQPDQFVRHAETVGQDLRKRRLVALADGLRAGDQRYRAIGLEADIDVLVRRATGALDVVRKPKAAQQSACLAVRAPRRKARDIGLRQRAIEGLAEMPAVHREPKRIGHRHRRQPAPCCGGAVRAIEAALPRRGIDQPLDDIDRLGKSRPARDADRRGVAEHRHDVQLDCGNRVDRCLADAHTGWSAPRPHRPPCRRRYSRRW